MNDQNTDPKLIGDIAAEFRRAWGMSEEPAKPRPQPDVAAIIRAQRLDRFREFCPPEFRARIDRGLIPNLAAWDRADEWAGSSPGLWLWSATTGRAKTRMLWRKFGQLHVEHGMSVMRVSGLNLAEEYHDAFNGNRTASFYRELTRCDVLMLDDLDKMPLPQRKQGFSEHQHADRNARMLREVFDHIYENHTPTLITANEPIQWFSERVGASAERRMRTTCTEIEF